MLQANPQARVTVTQQPVAPAPPPPPITTPGDLRALMEKRSEIGRQLESITDRREELAVQLAQTEGGARAGLQERIGTLDARAARLENEILRADDEIATALASGIKMEAFQGSGTSEPSGPVAGAEREFAVGGFFSVVLAAFLFYRWGWARARRRFSRGGTAPDPARMEQLQTAVDAIALEVERISEGQRYVTKVLGEGSAQPIGAEAGEEVLVRRKAT